ncbi:CSE1_2 [Sanghuangporus vaninii]
MVRSTTGRRLLGLSLRQYLAHLWHFSMRPSIPYGQIVTTEIVLRRIGLGLHEYASDPRGEDSWKRKDQNVYLLTAVATRGATAQQGVTSTNALVDVVDFFSRNVFEDLQADSDAAHLILQVDSIRFLYSF